MQKLSDSYYKQQECRETVYKSMDLFFKKEQLTGNNKYRCSKCKKLVNAQKGYLIHQLPNVLTIQVKRFNNFMQKINTHTIFPEEIDMSKYTQQTQSKPELYDLYGVLVHVGGGLHFGHYYCFVKNSNEQWYCMNDSSVGQRTFKDVAKERPYLLFYVKRETISRPKRRSSADLTTLQKDVIQQNSTPLTEQNKQEIKIDIPVQVKKTLCQEYKEINSTIEFKQHMKSFDNQYGIKQNTKPEEKVIEEVKEKEENKQNQNKQIQQNRNIEINSMIQNNKEQQMEIEINVNNKQEEQNKEVEQIIRQEQQQKIQQDRSQNNDEKYYSKLKDIMNNRYARSKYQVVRYKRIKKLRQKIRNEMSRSSITLGSTQCDSTQISIQNSVELDTIQNHELINGETSFSNLKFGNSNIKSEQRNNSPTIQPNIQIHINGETNQKTTQPFKVIEQKQAPQTSNLKGGLLKSLEQKSEQNINSFASDQKAQIPLNISQQLAEKVKDLIAGSKEKQNVNKKQKKIKKRKINIQGMIKIKQN